MRQHLAHGDRLLSVLAELRPVPGYGIIKADFAFFKKLHHGWSGGDHLGQRGKVKQCIQSHGLRTRDVGTVAESAAIHDPSVVANHHHRSWDFAAMNRLFDERTDTGEFCQPTRSSLIFRYSEEWSARSNASRKHDGI